MVTSGYVMQGSPNPDGHIFVPINPTSGTNNPGTRTRLGAGVVATVQPVATASTYVVALSELMFRYGMQDDSQLIGGRANGQSGANAQALMPGVIDQTPYSRTMRPPVPSAKVFGSGGNATAIPKGISVNAITVVYQPNTADLLLANVSMTKTQFAVFQQPAVTILLPPQNIYTGARTYPQYNTFPLVNPVMLTSRLAEYLIEFNFTTAATGTLNIYGMFLDVSYNFN